MQAELPDFITPAQEVFIRTHMDVPHVDAATWSLTVEGLVSHPLRLDLAALRALPATRLTAFHECFGSPFAPDVPVRAVANVEWLGVPLARLLDDAVPHADAAHLWFEGIDHGTFHGTPDIRYLKDLPLETAHRDVLLAYAMNGEPLEPVHGFPVRAVVPRMFGTNSVKWLRRIVVSDTRPEHLFTTGLYNRRLPGSDRPQPVRDVDVNSVLVAPRDEEELAAGTIEVRGWAWSATEVLAVEVAVDEGPWEAARLDERGPEPTWQRFTLPRRLEAGVHRIRCRARDRAGRVQPGPGSRNSVQEISVQVGARRPTGRTPTGAGSP
ncbi:molybdopterin-dependent oxidoreductase [Streptomyces sioyaensis]|uniref:molybdopterin-dependent oxidoreductase n=1 Tax=Streptomyces sioyaensis TaxID=67364 RepID=UPI0037B25128